MNATEEWLRYIENETFKRRYGFHGYDSEKSKEEEKESDENTKESDDV